MGNNASQSGNITQQRQQLEQEQQWAHSFPRSPQRVNQQQNKVLPDVTLDLHQKLRTTNNGEILYSGGTISGRHGNGPPTPREDTQNGVYRSSSISSKYQHEYSPKQDSSKARYYVPHQREDIEKSSPRRSRNMHHHNNQQRELQIKRFGSVPNLRGQDASHNHNRESSDHANKAKKKYKAPAPPRGNAFMTSNGSSLDSWEMNGDAADMPVRRQRLFKTNAEMKKKPTSPQNHRRSIDMQSHNLNSNENKKYRSKSREPQKHIPDVNADEIVSRNVGNKQNPGKHKMLADMQRSKSLPEFQAELREATQKLRLHKFNEIKQVEKILPVKNTTESQNKTKPLRHTAQERVDNKLRTLDPNINKKENLQFKMRQMEKNHINEKLLNVDPNINRVSNTKRVLNKEVGRGRASGKESTPEKSPPLKERGTPDLREQPAKTFYFGMDETAQSSTFNSNVVDHFALSLQKHNCILPAQTYSGSDLSSEIDMEESQVSANGIALHLRPILPKKQLEIPRFSPAAAWRLLSAFDSNPPPSTVSDEGPVFIEDRIEKLARQPPPISLPGVGPRSSHDKSGDSGISGDAGPTGFEDTPDPLIPNLRHNNLPISSSNCLLNLSWTPQQDLDGEEESSSDGAINNTTDDRYMHLRSTTGVKFSPRSQVFSLSLPRDNHLAAYMEEKAKLHTPPNFTNLQRLKRSVSGVLGNISAKVKESQPTMTQEQNDNWFLSRSAPNSLNNGFSSLEIRLSKHNNISPDLSDERSSLVPIPVKNIKNPNGGRVMYLPECLDKDKSDSHQKRTILPNEDIILKQQITIKEKLKMAQEYKEDRGPDFGLSNHNFRLSAMSKSCENISSGARHNKSPFEPEDLQDPPKIEEDKRKGRKTKRFKFQSTVRQIERKRLADKLSREAERKEQQRLGELEAMQRVEEEFQRKRAKEKASIRQQLRLFSMEDSAWSSLPLNWDSKDDVPMRSEPDGAVSSSASSPTHDNMKHLVETNQLSSKELSYNEIKSETLNKISKQKHSADSKSSPLLKKNVSRQGSESSDDTRVKAQATQVLSEYRQPRREYKDFRSSTSRLLEGNESPFHNDSKQTTVHPQVTYNMPKAHGHQGATTDGASRSSNYRRDFAHGIKSNDNNYSDDSPSNSKKHSPRLTQNHSSRQGKCIS